MKQKLLYICLMILCALAWSGEAWGQTPVYIETTAENNYELYSISTVDNYSTDEFELKGPGGMIFFEAKAYAKTLGWIGDMTANFFIQGRTANGDWDDIGKIGVIKDQYKPFSYQLAPEIKYIRFIAKKGSAHWKSVKTIKVTRATTLSFSNENFTTTSSSITFQQGTVSQSNTVYYNNSLITRNLTISKSGSNSNDFSVGAITGLGANGNVNADITFTPTAKGERSATITLSLPSISKTDDGKTITTQEKSVTISVSGTGYQYYTKAQAQVVPSSGGNVYASFSSITNSSNYYEDKNEVNAYASASATAYFKAENASGYNFKGWTLPDKSYTDGYLSEKGATFNETYTYNSEDSSNPTTKTYKAWFAPKATFNVSVGVGTVVGGTASTNWSPSTKTLEGTPGGTTVSTSVTYSATVSNTDNYKFCGWAESKTETNTSNIKGGTSYEVDLEGSAGSTINKTLYAIYAPIYYFKATANVGEHGGGTANASVTNRVEGTPNAQSGSAQASFTAEPYDGYVFVGWSESKSATTAEECVWTEETYEPLLNNTIPGNEEQKILYAIFAPVFNFAATYTKNREGGTVTASVANPTITGAPGDASASTRATFTATATEGSYVFKEWKTAVNASSYVSQLNPYTTPVDDPDLINNRPGSIATKTLVAIFAPLYNFSATAEVGSVKGGTASVSGYSAQIEGAPDATEGTTTATFTATASDGYKFAGWSESANGNIVYTDNPHNQTLTNKSPGTTESLTLYAIFKLDGLELNPGNPNYTPDNYSSITLNRTLKAGYSTIALPFDTDVSKLVKGRTPAYDSDDDWVAKLDIVTYNAQDGYTLYFQKVDGGTITANQPYVLHLGYEVKDPTWTDTTNGITVAAASAASVTPSTGYSGYAGWTMNANYEAGFSMAGKYGIVNSKGGLMLGSGEDAKLNAFTAYITGPTSGPNGAPQLRVAYVDEDGTATFIGSLPEDDLQGEPVAIYGPDGQRRSKMQRGVNIVRYADGTTRKINY